MSETARRARNDSPYRPDAGVSQANLLQTSDGMMELDDLSARQSHGGGTAELLRQPHLADNQGPPFKVDGAAHVEQLVSGTSFTKELYNGDVDALHWHDITVSLPANHAQDDKRLLSGVGGHALAGELVALMGPSGSGKTTLLNVLASRGLPRKAVLAGQVLVNNAPSDLGTIRRFTSYVEQEDHLIGCITARETLRFAAKLGLQERTTKADLDRRVDSLLAAFGLSEHADVIVGTPVQKGLSGGQKRRVSVASQLITGPKILFLDEPTSGLDSTASYEVVSYLKEIAQKQKLIIVASIHQPSTRTFNLFDKVYLLAAGRLCFGGPLHGIAPHFASIGLDMPTHINPAEWLLDIVSTDFSSDGREGAHRLRLIFDGWAPHEGGAVAPSRRPGSIRAKQLRPVTMVVRTVHLLHRNWLKSYRDLTAYWIRVAMYTCLAILMGTTWLRLNDTQDDITPRITALFFSGAFLSFMAVAYIPAFMEDQATYLKERANGQYGPTTFLVANILVGLPYMFLIVMIFAVVTYWMVNFWPTAAGFWTYVGFLFLDLLAAESLVVFVASVLPNFIIALAIVAFANGLWMCVNGFLVPDTVLNVFWRSWVTKIDYQSWTFRAMMWNEFHAQSFHCAAAGTCAYPPNSDGITIPGDSVLDYYGYRDGALGRYAGYILAIAFAYRLLAWLALYIRH